MKKSDRKSKFQDVDFKKIIKGLKFKELVDALDCKTLFGAFFLHFVLLFVFASLLLVVSLGGCMLLGVSARELWRYCKFVVYFYEIGAALLCIFIAFDANYGFSKEKREIARTKFKAKKKRKQLQKQFVEMNKGLINKYKLDYEKYCQNAEKEKNKFLTIDCSGYFYDSEDDIYIALSKNRKKLYIFTQISPQNYSIDIGEIIPPTPSSFEFMLQIPVNEINFYTNYDKVELTEFVTKKSKTMHALEGALIAGVVGAIIGTTMGATEKTSYISAEKNVTMISYNDEFLELSPKCYLYLAELLPDKEISVSEFWKEK